MPFKCFLHRFSRLSAANVAAGASSTSRIRGQYAWIFAAWLLLSPSLAAALDTDADGLDDALEGAADPDNDGLPNHSDHDSDGDGQPDRAEGLLDFDNDGIPGYLDTDDDGDGTLNATVVESPPLNARGLLTRPHDVDLDGIPNHLDLDSDNDGRLDADERLGDDDDDGIPNFIDANDTDGSNGDADGDGLTNGYERLNALNPLSQDSDDDGLLDNEEAFPPDRAPDTDSDSIVDPLDADDDNDAIPTAQELADAVFFDNGDDFDGDNLKNWHDRDSDGDGHSDALEGTTDSDGGGSPDYLDLDSDDDERLDAIEGVGDDDNDGITNRIDPLDEDGPIADADLDGLTNAQESALGLNAYSPDSDDDGLCDGAVAVTSASLTPVEVYPKIITADEVCVAGEFAASNQDSDSDGLLDALDPDDDNDNILTEIEVFYGVAFGNADSDNDTLPNHLDPDSDGDGHADTFESAGDFDGDGLPNFLDSDSDNDSTLDLAEPSDDTDRDGAFNIFDPAEDGPDADDDADSITNILEALLGTDPHLADSDHDSLLDPDEIGLQTFNPTNSDRDPFINALDPDDDNDRIFTLTEVEDESLALRALQSASLDDDTIPAHLDTNSDSDPLLDSEEGEVPTQNCRPFDALLPDVLFCLPAYLDTDELFSTTIDWDTDGLVNASELDLETNPRDPDSDRDGLCDGVVDVQSEVLGFVTTEQFCIAGEDAAARQDSDSDGTIDALDEDDDDDTILTRTELTDTNNNPSIGPDPDGDTRPNWLDIDSDDDFVPDADEPGDVNQNGIPDYLEPPQTNPEDTSPPQDTSDAASDVLSPEANEVLRGGCDCTSMTAPAPLNKTSPATALSLFALIAGVLFVFARRARRPTQNNPRL